MLSIMESNHELDPHQLLVEAERASAAPYVEYPAVSGWFAPGAGVWAAALVYVLTAHMGQLWIMAPAVAALLGIEAAWMAVYRRKWGTFPVMRHAPAEVRRVYVWYFVGVAVALVATALAYVGWGAAGATVSAFVTVTAGLTLYERSYTQAADATRARLADR
jgi:hypothetical protein